MVTTPFPPESMLNDEVLADAQNRCSAANPTLIQGGREVKISKNVHISLLFVLSEV